MCSKINGSQWIQQKLKQTHLPNYVKMFPMDAYVFKVNVASVNHPKKRNHSLCKPDIHTVCVHTEKDIAFIDDYLRLNQTEILMHEVSWSYLNYLDLLNSRREGYNLFTAHLYRQCCFHLQKANTYSTSV